MKITYIQNSKDLHIYIKKFVHYAINTDDLKNLVPSIAIKSKGVLEEDILNSSKDFGVFSYNNEGYFFIIGQIKSVFELLKAKKTKYAKDIILNLSNFDKEHRYSITYNKKVLHMSDLRPLVMGVLNLTQDSFYEASRTKEDEALKKVEEFVNQGVDIIDLGPQSTRPGAQEISSEEEVSKLLNVLKSVRKEFENLWISVDTYYANTAKIALENGADIINDISGGVFDKDMLKVIATYNCPYILGHSSVYKPATWPNQDFDYEDIVLELIHHFKSQIQKLLDLRYNLHNGIIIDPCIGFAKKAHHNIQILHEIEALRSLNKPILIGVSRKSFIGVIIKEFLNKPIQGPEQRLIGSLGAIAQSIIKRSCNIARTHDVEATKEFIAVLDSIRNYHYA